MTVTTTSDETAVRDAIDQLNSAWGDAGAYCACFTADADYVTFFGARYRGREAIAEAHRPLFDGVLHGSRLVGETASVRFVAPGVAVVHGTGAVLKRGRKRASRRATSSPTFVMVREDDGRWRCAAFANTRYRPGVERFSNWLAARMVPKSRRG
jgi:uncharacterized protein (TIGR02246 family)